MLAKKRFGQNFLQDQNIIRHIISVIAPQKNDLMLEVGPGHGELTRLLVDTVNKLHVVEIDRDLIPCLLQLAAQKKNLQVHNQDILEFDLTSISKAEHSLRVVGNLPYNISTPLLFRLIDHKFLIQDIYVMLQNEVVERIVAEPDTEHYGRLSIMLQYHCAVEKLISVPPHAFNPPPQVDSAVIKLTPFKESPITAKNYVIFAEVVKQAFSQRRKMIRNTLKSFLGEEAILSLGISPLSRAENLSIKDYVKMSDFLFSKKDS
jgi:16S rRNA (adenine1518-N6/adenine1519-N6)-dimethyltransferase